MLSMTACNGPARIGLQMRFDLQTQSHSRQALRMFLHSTGMLPQPSRGAGVLTLCSLTTEHSLVGQNKGIFPPKST